MANCIPFEKLEVGKTYYCQSDYWDRVLGLATIEELDIQMGDGYCSTSWGDHSGRCHFNANDTWMWDEMPTEEETRDRKRRKYTEWYYPPRMVEGVAYCGHGIDAELAKKLDQTIIDLLETFWHAKFKRDRRNPACEFIWESKLNIPLSSLLIRNGDCDWEVINYLKKNGGFNIYAGERDSCGWLTGVIEHPSAPNRRILYG